MSRSGDAATMFLVVRLVDVLWTRSWHLVDKHNPRWQIPRVPCLCRSAAHGLRHPVFLERLQRSLLFAYVTYVGMSMCYTLVNVPYGALNSSLTPTPTRSPSSPSCVCSWQLRRTGRVGRRAHPRGVLAAQKRPLEMALFMGLGSLPSFIFMPMVPPSNARLARRICSTSSLGGHRGHGGPLRHQQVSRWPTT
jgi:hypothetical protein